MAQVLQKMSHYQTQSQHTFQPHETIRFRSSHSICSILFEQDSPRYIPDPQPYTLHTASPTLETHTDRTAEVTPQAQKSRQATFSLQTYELRSLTQVGRDRRCFFSYSPSTPPSAVSGPKLSRRPLTAALPAARCRGAAVPRGGGGAGQSSAHRGRP